MATSHTDPLTTADCLADAAARAAHAAHEVRLLKTLAADAVEDGVHAARRAATRGARGIEEFRETTAYRIKKSPFLAVALAAGAGLIVGAVCGRWGRCATRQED